MKKLLLTALALAGFAGGAFAQGLFILDSSNSNNGLRTSDNSSIYYTGVAGFEVWELNSSTIPAGLNALAATSGLAAYNTLSVTGFKLEATITGMTGTAGQGNNVVNGVFTIGTINMPDASGNSVVVAIAAWNTTNGSWASMLQAADANTRAGVLAWNQPIVAPASPPPTPPATAWGVTQDLVMTPVPEPSTFALAGLGAAALLIFRRRR